MKKNTKKAYTSGGNFPEVINMDSLSYLDEESLGQMHEKLQNDRNRAYAEGSDVTAWEVEICYVQRELKIRSTRRSIHEKYVRSNPDHSYYFDDDNAEVSAAYDQNAN